MLVVAVAENILVADQQIVQALADQAAAVMGSWVMLRVHLPQLVQLILVEAEEVALETETAQDQLAHSKVVTAAQVLL
jgi:hypothetical protein